MGQHVGWNRHRQRAARKGWCEIELNGIGKLTAPVIIAAFEGWNDAGEAASGVITHLTETWQAEPVGAIDPEDFYDFQVTRPVTDVTDGATRRLVWPTTPLLRRAGGGLRRAASRDGSTARRAAGRLAAHPAGARHHERLGPGAGLGPARLPRRLQGPDRDHRRAPARVRRGRHRRRLAVGRGAALRGAAAEP